MMRSVSCGPLREPHDTHPSAADLPDQAPGTDAATLFEVTRRRLGPLRGSRLCFGEQVSETAQWFSIEDAAGVVTLRQKRLDLAQQFEIAAADRSKVSSAGRR